VAKKSVKVDVDLHIHDPIEVLEEEAVPVALIINELVVNAIKHARPNGEQQQIKVFFQADDDLGQLFILSPGGRLPDGFDFQTGAGCGTGLDLVRGLLPRSGMTILYQQMPTEVITKVILTEPVVRTILMQSCECGVPEAECTCKVTRLKNN
jgi:two-component sensor histidine kinase